MSLALDLSRDVVSLTRDLVDAPSESGQEEALVDAVESALGALGHLEVFRVGNTVVARTSLGRAERVILAGHLDTVPENANLPSSLDAEFLHGLGSCDMKGGVAVALRLAASVPEPNRDITFVLYDCEEVEAERNGLAKLATSHPDLLEAAFALLMEPSNARVEGGCQGTLRADVVTRGTRAHSARAWLGENAIHAAADVLERLSDYRPRRPVIDGLEYCEGLNAVGISGGVAGNVVPDECRVTVNYRFAPDRSLEDAEAHVREVFEGYALRITDAAPGALPGLSVPAAAAFVDAVGGEVAPKFGWTDVSLFSALGVPAVNYGPGDPSLAHRRDERVPLAQLHHVEERLRSWLEGTE